MYRFIFCLLLGWLSQLGLTNAQLPDSFPTQWKFEVLQDDASEWWHSLNINMVPGVSYTLQKSHSLEAGSWDNLFSQYGSDANWVCPLFPGQAPATPPTFTPHIPSAPSSSDKSVSLMLERDQSRNVLLSWNSLDDNTPRRILLTGTVLDPIWDEFDTFYLNQHGGYFYSISPQLFSPVTYNSTPPTLGPKDNAMVQAFQTALPAITSNIQNSVTAFANYTPVPSDPANSAFYRVAADWTLDSDSDGRLDWQEIILDGNNPFAADSDGDGTQDVAQDNSGPEPSLEGDGAQAPPAAAATALPPLASIEINTATVIRTQDYKPSDPDYVSTPIIDADEGLDTSPFISTKTFSAFSSAVADIPLTHGEWSSYRFSFSDIYFRSDVNIFGYTESLRAVRCGLRLRLTGPAPEGGYRIPLRIISYSYVAKMNDSTPYPYPLTNISFEDVILEVAAGQTLGIPVQLNGVPNLGINQHREYLPCSLAINSSNFTNDPNFTPRYSDRGVCVVADEGLRADLTGYMATTYEPQITLTWEKQRLRGNGTLGPWETMTPQTSHSESRWPPTQVRLNTREYAYLRSDAGIFQFQAVFSFPDGTKIPVPYLRMAHSQGIFNSKQEPNPLLKAGEMDYIGVCRDKLSLNVRNEAVRWLDSTAYAFENQASIQSGNILNPSTKRRNKCNLFVTHIANRAGAYTPYYYRSKYISGFNVIPSAPIAKDDWHLNPEINIDLDPPGWLFRGVNGTVTPGMTAASFGVDGGSGHVGILDYDGSWINAGPLNINKSLHLPNLDSRYKPTHFRAR